MSRFQAMTNAVLDLELDALRVEMGLRESQKAELLSELAGMASWLVAQSRAGRTVEARGPDGVEVFRHPVLTSAASFQSLVLTPDEAERLMELMNTPSELSDPLHATLLRLTAPDRTPPTLEWPES